MYFNQGSVEKDRNPIKCKYEVVFATLCVVM